MRYALLGKAVQYQLFDIALRYDLNIANTSRYRMIGCRYRNIDIAVQYRYRDIAYRGTVSISHLQYLYITKFPISHLRYIFDIAALSRYRNKAQPYFLDCIRFNL